MEILAIIGGLVVAWFVIGFFLYVRKGAKYINLLNKMGDLLDTYDYQMSDIHKARVSYMDEVGLATALNEIIAEIRSSAASEFEMSLNDFGGSAIMNAENQFIMRYALAHGKGEEFQNAMTIGSQIEELKKSKMSKEQYINKYGRVDGLRRYYQEQR